MKLKPQPPRRSGRTARVTKPRRGSRLRGRGARRPGTPLRQRLAGRLPSIRRAIAAAGAMAAAAVLVALLGGPWLRVSDVTWAGAQYTDADDLSGLLGQQRGVSVLAVDTNALRTRLEGLPSVASATVTASLTGRVDASVVERQAAFVWETASARFLGAADGTIFLGNRRDSELQADLAALPHISDERFAARLITVGDVIPDGVLRTALRIGAIDPAALGSAATAVAVRLDDEFGFRIVSVTPEWEVALGVYGLDPLETAGEAEARLERQVTAVRTLFASHPEAGIGWVDVRNPGKVYFRAKG